jgi:F-type H+-transporting ATPase subunit a
VSIYGPLEHAGVPQVFQAAALVSVLLLVVGFVVRRQLAAANGGVVPDEGVTVRNVVELVVDGLANLARENMGEDWRRWFPLVGTIFVFILIGNLLNLIPGVGGPTANINTTAAWALISVLVSEYAGIQKHGMHYVDHFLGPRFDIGGHHIPMLAFIFIPLELIGHVARVVTLSIRLLANMFADHTLVVIFLGLVPIAVPAIFLGLGTMVSVLQAFVFALLTMVYIGLNLEDAH